jgi:hypothetical protein
MQQSCYALLAITVFAVGLVACGQNSASVPARLPGSPVPKEIQELFDARNEYGAAALGERILDQSVGQPFPDIPFRDEHGLMHSSRDFLGKRTAFFMAGGCPSTRSWLKALRGSDWRLDGISYDQLVFLVERADHDMPLPKHVPSYEVGWPLPGFLSYSLQFPIVFLVSSDGLFEGYKFGPKSKFRGKQDSN